MSNVAKISILGRTNAAYWLLKSLNPDSALLHKFTSEEIYSIDAIITNNIKDISG